MMVCSREVHVQGRLVRIAHLDGDKYEVAGVAGNGHRRARNAPMRIDLFTFSRKLPYSAPRHEHSMKWDNLAVMSISTFDHWWTKQINNKTRNMVRASGENSGWSCASTASTIELVRGITTIYNEVPNRQGKPFPHYGKDFETIRKMKATFPDQSTFIGGVSRAASWSASRSSLPTGIARRRASCTSCRCTSIATRRRPTH